MTDQNNAAQAAEQAIRHVLEPYAESYDMMTRMAEREGQRPTVSTTAVAVDIRGNMIPGLIEALSKLRAEGVQAGDERMENIHSLISQFRNATRDDAKNGGRNYFEAASALESKLRQAVDALASAPVAGEAREHIEQMAVNRYRPVPDGKLSYKVVAGDGTRSLYTGTKDSCLRVAAKLTEAFLDGAFVASDAAPQASAPVAGEAVAYRVGTDLFLPEALPAAERYAEIRQKPLEPLYAAPQASDTVRDQALEDAAQAAYTALFPTNDRSDWTEFAESAAYSAKWAAQCIRALKSQSSALSAQPGAQKGGSDA